MLVNSALAYLDVSKNGITDKAGSSLLGTIKVSDSLTHSLTS